MDNLDENLERPNQSYDVEEDSPPCKRQRVITSLKTDEEIDISDSEVLGNCRDVKCFRKLNCIGEGNFGIVYRVVEDDTYKIFAIKKLIPDNHNEGLSMGSLREITILRKCNHENIVKFQDVVVGGSLDNIYLVMEYCDNDLGSIIDNTDYTFTTAEVKCLLLQVLEGVRYIHSHYIIHRDLKMSNLLLTSEGQVKIADFGLSRFFSIPFQEMTPQLVTLWYRAPEVLLSSKLQTTAIDMWAVGCIFGELLLKKPLIPGKSELGQLKMIIDLLGAPTELDWPDLKEILACVPITLPEQPHNNLENVFPDLSESGIRLMNELFTYDPKKRATAESCLESSYFHESPIPCERKSLKTFPPEWEEDERRSIPPEEFIKYKRMGIPKLVAEHIKAQTIE